MMSSSFLGVVEEPQPYRSFEPIPSTASQLTASSRSLLTLRSSKSLHVLINLDAAKDPAISSAVLSCTTSSRVGELSPGEIKLLQRIDVKNDITRVDY